jgi:hypothetical protein
VLRPVVELFRDGEILDSISLYRHGAFNRPTEFPFRRLRTYRDRVELRWPNREKPPQVILFEWRPLYFGGAFPYFLCYKCEQRARRLYLSSIDVACRKCSDLQFKSQRHRRRARLRAKAEKIRNRLWTENGNPAKPYQMHHATYRKHLRMLQAVEHAIRINGHCASIRYRRQRERDEYGQYCDRD